MNAFKFLHVFGSFLAKRAQPTLAGMTRVIGVTSENKVQLRVGGSPMHGAIWHAMHVLSVNRGNSSALMWEIALRLCQLNKPRPSIVYQRCLHGTGHGMVIATLSRHRVSYRACSYIATFRTVPSLLVRAADEGKESCANAALFTLAYLCAGGVYDLIRQSLSVSVLVYRHFRSAVDWPCSSAGPFAGACFSFYYLAELPESVFEHCSVVHEQLREPCYYGVGLSKSQHAFTSRTMAMAGFLDALALCSQVSPPLQMYFDACVRGIVASYQLILADHEIFAHLDMEACCSLFMSNRQSAITSGNFSAPFSSHAHCVAGFAMGRREVHSPQTAVSLFPV